MSGGNRVYLRSSFIPTSFHHKYESEKFNKRCREESPGSSINRNKGSKNKASAK